MFLWMVGLAWGDTLHLPDGQSAEQWRDALALTGLTVTASVEGADAALVKNGEQWTLRVRSADGTWRTARVPAPDSAASRENIARTVLLMQENRETVEHPWTLPPDTLPPDTLPLDTLPPLPPQQPPPPPWQPPPLRELRPPSLATSVPDPIYPLVLPQKTAITLDVLQPTPVAPPEDPERSDAPWLWGDAGMTVRPGMQPALHLGVATGLWLQPQRRVGISVTGQSTADLTDLQHIDGTLRAVQVGAGLWQTRTASRVPLSVGGGGGVNRLVFLQDGQTIQAAIQPMVFAELSTGESYQLVFRLTETLGRITLEEVVADVPQTSASLSQTAIWIGARIAPQR